MLLAVRGRAGTFGGVMRLRTKALLFMGLYLGGPFLMLLFAPRPPTANEVGAVLVVWFLVFAVAQAFVIRCPRSYCGRCAFITPNGRATPFVGSHCRHCGEPY